MIYKGEEAGYVAECFKMPVITQGTTIDEMLHNLREAITIHLQEKTEIFNDRLIEGYKMRQKENLSISKDFETADLENWDD
jgi:predicted RNase H-like HicB family nuclease